MDIAGLILAAAVALAAYLLRYWENVRPKWPRVGALDRLSIRLRSFGIWLLWLEALLLAIGSQLPIELRRDRLLFVMIWAIIGFLAIILLILSIADSIIRLVAHRVRATAIEQVMQSRIGPTKPDSEGENPGDTEFH
jgi:hypothetical protein